MRSLFILVFVVSCGVDLSKFASTDTQTDTATSVSVDTSSKDKTKETSTKGAKTVTDASSEVDSSTAEVDSNTTNNVDFSANETPLTDEELKNIFTCTGTGLYKTVPDPEIDDGGGSDGNDNLEIYCDADISRFCLSHEKCPWREGKAGLTETCSVAGLNDAYFADILDGARAVRLRLYCSVWGEISKENSTTNTIEQKPPQELFACTGTGLYSTIDSHYLTVGGTKENADLEIYCDSGISRFCLSSENCPWRDGATGLSETCSSAGLKNELMVNIHKLPKNKEYLIDGAIYCSKEGQVF